MDNYAGASRNTRSSEVKELLDAVQPLLIEFIARADQAGQQSSHSQGSTKQGNNLLVDYVEPAALQHKVLQSLPLDGTGNEGVLQIVQHVLRYSTNTWHQGFMDKLYGSTNAVGVASELVLGVLNTNVHVYKVSPALTVIEKVVTRALANKFGMADEHAGGIIQAGGSASNLTALVIARNTLFPRTKVEGSGAYRFAVFTSAHGHYSFEKAAQICGMGASAVRSVKVDDKGQMITSDLEEEIRLARADGCTPLLVNGTAGTTVLGSYDPLAEIASICRREGLWFHVDGSWGASVVFSDTQRRKLSGVQQADSLTINPHKMLGTPIQCSFLLTNDLRKFWKSNTLPASYLFHNAAEDDGSETWDLADLTLQCGRRGDALKLALSWTYYGANGFGVLVDEAFRVAAYFASKVEQHPDLRLISDNPPPCLQVCFDYTPSGADLPAEETSRIVRQVTDSLVDYEFLVDYAKGSSLFFRAVVSLTTSVDTVDRLVRTIASLANAERR